MELLPQVIANLHKERRWCQSSALRHMLGLRAFLDRLDQYCRVKVSTVGLWTSSWSDLQRYWSRRARAVANRLQPFMTTEEMREALSKPAMSPRIRYLLIVCWAMAARPSNAVMLQARDIVVNPDGTIVVFWRNSKTSARIGAFHTFSELGIYAAEKALYISQFRPSDYLFSDEPQVTPNNKAILSTLKWAKKAIGGRDLRVLRRGALTALALTGLSEEALMALSGNTCPRTLHRYLGWGRYRKNIQTQISRAASALW